MLAYPANQAIQEEDDGPVGVYPHEGVGKTAATEIFIYTVSMEPR